MQIFNSSAFAAPSKNPPIVVHGHLERTVEKVMLYFIPLYTWRAWKKRGSATSKRGPTHTHKIVYELCVDTFRSHLHMLPYRHAHHHVNCAAQYWISFFPSQNFFQNWRHSNFWIKRKSLALVYAKNVHSLQLTKIQNFINASDAHTLDDGSPVILSTRNGEKKNKI